MHHALRALPIALLVIAGAAFAADAPGKKEGRFGGGKGSGAYLTKEQLRACLARRGKTKEQDADLVKEKAAIALQKDEIARVGEALKARLEGVDRSNAEAVAAYNDAAQARDQQIDAYQARVTAFNTRIDANQTERDAFAQACSNRRYFEEDELAIRKGK